MEIVKVMHADVEVRYDAITPPAVVVVVVVAVEAKAETDAVKRCWGTRKALPAEASHAWKPVHLAQTKGLAVILTSLLPPPTMRCL